MPARPWIDEFSSGYMQRMMHRFPKQGDREPWINPQNYSRDKKMIRFGALEDGALIFSNRSTGGDVCRSARTRRAHRGLIYQIINSGGLLYQFLGDGVIGLFGLPDRAPGFAEAALLCAHALAEVGRPVANEWQRRIDRVQVAEGVHIGMAMGDLEIMSLRPFGRAHMGAVGDCINMAARLCGVAGPSEVVVSNTFLQQLGLPAQARFAEIERWTPATSGASGRGRFRCARWRVWRSTWRAPEPPAQRVAAGAAGHPPSGVPTLSPVRAVRPSGLRPACKFRFSALP